MAVYCTSCARGKDWPRPAVRTGRRPCDFCGSEDRGGNYSYPDNLLPGMPNEINAVAEREEQESRAASKDE